MFNSLRLMADAQSASEALRSSISPTISAMFTIGAVLCVLVVVFGGYYYMTSGSNPDKLERAKRTIRNAIIGLVIILGSGVLVSVMSNANPPRSTSPVQIEAPQPKVEQAVGIGDVVNEAIKGFVKGVVESVGQSVVGALKQFTTATPLMAQNGSVFNLWAVMVAITDILFLIVIGLIGFKIMTASSLGFEDYDLNTLLPQIILTFIVANLSIFAIDAIITVSNAMIQALMIGMSNEIIWTALGGLVIGAAAINIGVLLFVLVAIVLAVLLLVYYLKRIIILYIGAVLSPLIAMLWLVPVFRDFAIASAKIYISTIFALFVQVVILMLAVSLFAGLVQGEGNPFMTSLLAIATLSLLLTTNKTMNQLSILNLSNQGLRKLGSTFVKGFTHVADSMKETSKAPSVDVQRVSPSPVTPGGSSISSSSRLITGETRPAPISTAAAALTEGRNRNVVVAGGADKPNVNLTDIPSVKATRVRKEKQ